MALYRPPDDEQTPLNWAVAADPITEITLHEFTVAEAEELTRLKLQQLWPEAPAITAALLDNIIAKAQGNPF